MSKCVKAGVKCSDCENLIHCVDTPAGMISHKLNFCKNTMGEYCSAKDGGCSPDPASCKIFGLKEFPCQNSSTFPDPYDCNSYHQCVELDNGSLTTSKFTCAEDRAFDPLTATCRFKMNHRVCKESPVPKCLYPLQTGALKENPSIYYVCIKMSTPYPDIIPYLYKCRTGEEYKPTAHACVESHDSDMFSCVGEGTFIDPNDNSKYYKCNKDKSYVHGSCEKGHYFNINQGSCQKISDLETKN